MNDHAITWFEIPTADLDRATRFYEAVVGRPLERAVFGGMPIALFTAPGVGGALVAEPDRRPSAEGALVYLNAGSDLEGFLSRGTAAGGKVLMPRTSIGEHGFVARIRDTEGNIIALHAPPA